MISDDLKRLREAGVLIRATMDDVGLAFHMQAGDQEATRGVDRTVSWADLASNRVIEAIGFAFADAAQTLAANLPR